VDGIALLNVFIRLPRIPLLRDRVDREKTASTALRHHLERG
jgi:hypothetical protein